MRKSDNEAPLLGDNGDLVSPSLKEIPFEDRGRSVGSFSKSTSGVGHDSETSAQPESCVAVIAGPLLTRQDDSEL